MIDNDVGPARTNACGYCGYDGPTWLSISLPGAQGDCYVQSAEIPRLVMVDKSREGEGLSRTVHHRSLLHTTA